MKVRMAWYGMVIGGIMITSFTGFTGKALAGDATLTLDDNAGSSSFVVQDVDKVNQFKVNSDGQGYFAGNVGIGTTAPSTKLEIAMDSNTKTSFYPNYYTPAKFDYQDPNGPSTYFSFGYPYTNGIYLNSYFNGADVVSEDTINPHWGILFTGCSACSYPENHFVIRSAPATTGLPTFTDRFVIQGSNGNVGIGTTAPTERLDVAGNIKASGTVSQGSSKEFKKNISSVSTKDAMNALNKLNPVRFEYKVDDSGEKHLGFIAEDVPDLVAEEDRKHLNSMDITAVLTKVVQEQQRMLQQYNETISVLSAKVKKLENKVY